MTTPVPSGPARRDAAPIPRELLRSIRNIEIRTAHLVDAAFSGHYASAFRGMGMEFEEVRPYQVGDDVRSIDWNVSARAGEPFVKLFREERELTLLLVADLSASQDFGSDLRRKREMIAELTAVLAFAALRKGDRIGLVVATDRVERVVPPAKGRQHALRLVRDVLAHEPQGRGTDLAGALEHVRRIQRRRAVVFVLSDFRATGWDVPLGLLRRRHDTIAVVVEDPRESALPDAGIVDLVDPETGRSVCVDLASRRVRDGFARAARMRRDALDRTLRRLRVERLTLPTGASAEQAIDRFFRTRRTGHAPHP
ncbi:MAG: DUF58 domain-containing protein [Phycisphaeraceae bacterium]|nr:DUF58 domain-containing protein [Phycisphaeraceae bacterium]